MSAMSAGRFVSKRVRTGAKMKTLVMMTAAFALCAIAIEMTEARTPSLDMAWGERRRIMPWQLVSSGGVRGLKISNAVLKAVDSRIAALKQHMDLSLPAGPRPNILLFVVESLRPDYLTKETAPNLAGFRQDCLNLGDGYSNGNATHLGWYALFTSNFPQYLIEDRSRQELWGSLPIRVLKNSSYRVGTFAATYLDYHGLDEIIFGRGLKLADEFVDCRKLESGDFDAQDIATTEALMADLRSHKEKTARFVFFQSTHFGYCWSKNFEPPFAPFAERVSPVESPKTETELRAIQNRYRNSICFVDSLIGKILAGMKRDGTYDDSLIVILGDHGEEFLEEGRMFHANGLSVAQTRIPFYFKPPAGMVCPGMLTHEEPASHMDVFPTIFDFLGLHNSALFEGQSLFHKTDNVVVTAAQNGARDTVEFFLAAPDMKAWFAYDDDGTKIGAKSSVYFTRLTTPDGRRFPPAGNDESRILMEKFGPALIRLYPGLGQ
jgi:membrane-anchored protein YejM (alkaline phosphatase superfamily)